jgi:hypothetical protein
MAVESLILEKRGKDKCDSLALHVVLKQYPARIDYLLAADPLEKLLLILKMIIKGHPDYTGAIRDQLDRDLLNRLLQNQLFKTL